MAEQFEFVDRMSWDGAEKTAVSVRDGVLEYLGAELGKSPADKVFTVYRSPATIANVASMMAGIPLTDEHVSVGSEISDPVGKVLSGEMIDLDDPAVGSKLAIKNRVEVSGSMLDALKEGKRELSLGYTGDLVPHDKYDFEQREIQPHHLAVVAAGRCGSSCSFIDKKPENEMAEQNPFLDAEGMPSLEQIAQLGAQLTEAIKTLPLDEFKKAWPTLKKIVEASAEADPSSVKEAVEETVEEEGEEMPSEDAEPKEDEEEKEKTPVTDSAAFKDALTASTKAYAATVEKARDFLKEDYPFADKSAIEIQRDALKSELPSETFADADLSLAFKMLKKTQSTLKTFGDSAETGLMGRIKSELEG